MKVCVAFTTSKCCTCAGLEKGATGFLVVSFSFSYVDFLWGGVGGGGGGGWGQGGGTVSEKDDRIESCIFDHYASAPQALGSAQSRG